MCVGCLEPLWSVPTCFASKLLSVQLDFPSQMDNEARIIQAHNAVRTQLGPHVSPQP